MRNNHYLAAAITALLFCSGFGQTMCRADMMADSPVTFPETGALPSNYPPDVDLKDRIVPEEGYSIFGTPQRSLEQIKKIQAEMTPGKFTPPPHDWKYLPKMHKILEHGGDLHLFAMGDSIVADTMRSGWIACLREAYPKANIKSTVYVRGGGGCQHYKEEDRVAKNVIPLKPDVVFIGGISQKDMESIRTVITQLRSGLPGVEIFLATGVFGSTDPRDAEAMAKAHHSGTGQYGKDLKNLADEMNCAFVDMTTPWVEYMLSSNVHPHIFYRDRVHANPYGEQIICKIIMSFFKPE